MFFVRALNECTLKPTKISVYFKQETLKRKCTKLLEHHSMKGDMSKEVVASDI